MIHPPAHRLIAARIRTLAAAALLAGSAGAAAGEPPHTLPPVRAVAAPLDRAAPDSLPASLDRIRLDPQRGGSERHIGDALRGVPGVQVRDRQNHARDTQLSIRGVGARASFGIRGIRLLLDGLPVSLPDGQGQISHLLAAASDGIDVLRGPFSALHGNASGGAILVHSARIAGEGEALRLRASTGSHGTHSTHARWLAGRNGHDLALTAAGYRSDGFRAHSAARAAGLNAVAGLDAGAAGRLTLALLLHDQPEALDPLGLDRVQWRQDPAAAADAALQFDPRKAFREHRLAAIWEADTASAGHWRLGLWQGRREVEQFLAIPVAAQRNPLSSGGAIDLNHVHDGFDLRHGRAWQAPGGEMSLTLGLALERLRQHRRGFENFVGDRLGVRGALRRDEINRARAEGSYAQLQWATGARGSLLLGLRRSRVELASSDRYVTPDNPDDSGAAHHARTVPVAGYLHRFSPSLRGWLAAGGGFETPTLAELAYRADGRPGLAFDLRPARSRNLEVGLAAQRGRTAWRLVVHGSLTDDELAVVRNVGGRSSFANLGDTRRRGIEAWIRHEPVEGWQIEAAAEWLDARFRRGFLRCAGAVCPQPDTEVAAGSPLPGIAARQAFLRLHWQPRPGWEAAIESEARAAIPVADGSPERAPGHALVHVALRRVLPLRGARLAVYARVENLFDRAHVASVIVNESNRRYHEPGPGRSLLFGLEWNRP
ncbi:MAG: ligand-gated channel [Lysobacteraceae bacterium]|nr:MAG: ligand-gated channel [Xanthomonadaceae bacterium]